MKTKKSGTDLALVSRLDQCAQLLLDGAYGGNNSGGGPAQAGEGVTLADQIKAFTAVSSWASARTALMPEDKGKGKGELLRQRFHGRKARGGASPDSVEDDPASGSAASLNGTGERPSPIGADAIPSGP